MKIGFVNLTIQNTYISKESGQKCVTDNVIIDSSLIKSLDTFKTAIVTEKVLEKVIC